MGVYNFGVGFGDGDGIGIALVGGVNFGRSGDSTWMVEVTGFCCDLVAIYNSDDMVVNDGNWPQFAAAARQEFGGESGFRPLCDMRWDDGYVK